MKKYIDLTSWVLLFAMAPFTILVLLSQNTGPGDLFYPVKRGMENVILAGASVNPAVKVAFRTGLTEQRYKEAEKLLLVQADTQGLENLAQELASAEEELLKVSSPEQRKVASENLIAKIEQYDKGLAQVELRIEQAPTTQPTVEQPSGPQFTPTVAPQPTQDPQIQQPLPTQPSAQTPQPVTAPTLQPTSQPVQTPNVVVPTPVGQTPLPIITTPIDSEKKEKAKEKVGDSRKDLAERKKRVENTRDDAEVRQKFEEEQKKLREGPREEEKRDDQRKGESQSVEETATPVPTSQN